MYGVASLKYEEALQFISDFIVLKGYAQSLCGYLKMERTSTSAAALSQGKEKVLYVVNDLRQRHNTEGIAEILKSLPQRGEYADIVCAAFSAIMSVDALFFTRGRNMSRSDLVHYPKIFFLDDDTNPQEYLNTAAAIYQEVVRDSQLEYIYGEVHLRWISALHSAELVIAIVQHAVEDSNLNVVVAGKLFKQNIRDEVNITDHDVEVHMRAIIF
jgi:hypothetical protein